MDIKFPKRLFKKMMRVSAEFHKTKREFDKKVTEIYGIHYSDNEADDDWIIDAIDYGAGFLDYNDFCRRMTHYSKEAK